MEIAMAKAETTHRGTVLVVDDEPDLSWVMRFNLEVEGYRTYAAADGKTALHVLREHHPEVMILDVMMPVMDGWSVLEELQDVEGPDRPRVVVVSARTSPEDRRRATALGVDAFIPKPFELDDLIEVVGELCPRDGNDLPLV